MKVSQAFIEKALKWKAEHAEHVERLMGSGTNMFAPSRADAGHPELWKAASWRWLMTNKAMEEE
ncbi:MAG: hypothetical protein DRP45_12075 [Candidatus Zixiibacteriota bacterium]|nr:MAG: hypothetical protein DRP45_12075 [candidate division Zixibacteria bacterium]